MRLSSCFATLAFLAVSVVAEPWPQWRGPSLDGSSGEKDLPLHWSREENVVWTLSLPARGAATPIVWDDRIFLNVGEKPEKSAQLALWGIDRDTGKVLWKRSLGGGNVLQYKQHMSTPSPVTDGEHVWVLTGTGVLKAFDFAGQEIWGRDLQADYGRFGLQWGYASSPLLVDDALYIQVLHGMKTDEASYVLRLDKATGKTLWRIERPTEAARESPDAYTTPGLLRHGAGAQLVISGGDVVTGHDLTSGRELWRVGGLNPEASPSQRIVASPLIDGNRFFTFGKRGPILAFELGGEGKARPLWSAVKGTDVPTPVTDGEHLYIVDDQGIAWCYEAATGKVVWGPERLATGTYSASPVLADGKIYAINEEGTTTVIAAGPKLEILAQNKLGEYVLASPAISEGQIFLRTDQALYAIGKRRGVEGP